jgi:hypothetical protein
MSCHMSVFHTGRCLLLTSPLPRCRCSVPPGRPRLPPRGRSPHRQFAPAVAASRCCRTVISPRPGSHAASRCAGAHRGARRGRGPRQVEQAKLAAKGSQTEGAPRQVTPPPRSARYFPLSPPVPPPLCCVVGSAQQCVAAQGSAVGILALPASPLAPRTRPLLLITSARAHATPAVRVAAHDKSREDAGVSPWLRAVWVVRGFGLSGPTAPPFRKPRAVGGWTDASPSAFINGPSRAVSGGQSAQVQSESE